MIEIIGLRRLSILLFLLCINAGLGAGVYYYVMPDTERVTRQLTRAQNDLRARQNDVNRLMEEFDKIEDMRDRFDVITRRGFFKDQDRLEAKARIEEIERISGVIAVRYTINPAQFHQTEALSRAGHVIMNQSVILSIDAFDDIDIYRFIYLLEDSFLGHVSIETLTMNRTRRINDSVLRAVGAGRSPPLVQATLSFGWRTLVPENEFRASAGAGRPHR